MSSQKVVGLQLDLVLPRKKLGALRHGALAPRSAAHALAQIDEAGRAPTCSTWALGLGCLGCLKSADPTNVHELVLARRVIGSLQAAKPVDSRVPVLRHPQTSADAPTNLGPSRIGDVEGLGLLDRLAPELLLLTFLTLSCN